MDALDTFIREKPSGCLYHYTGTAGLIGIIQSRKLWATDYRHLNDRKEYQIGARLLQHELRNSKLKEKQRSHFERLVADTQKACLQIPNGTRSADPVGDAGIITLRKQRGKTSALEKLRSPLPGNGANGSKRKRLASPAKL